MSKPNNNYKGKGRGSSNRNDFKPKQGNQIQTAFSDNSANYSFNQPLGAILDFTDQYVDDYLRQGLLKRNNSVPGILTFKTIPVPGVSADYNSPLNVCARSMFSYIRHANSGAVNYEAVDLMMYLLAMDYAYIWYMELTRVNGVLMNFDRFNKYTPEAVVNALGFDYSSLSNNMPKFRNIINKYASLLSTLAVPSSLGFIGEHIHAFGNIFKDEESKKDQLYVFIPNVIGYYSFFDTSSGSYGGIKLIDRKFAYPGETSPLSSMTLDRIETVCDTILDNLINDTDIATISGDIIKAYGEGNLYSLNLVQVDDRLGYVYDKDMLWKIHNARWLTMLDTGLETPYYNLDKITQEVGENTHWIKFIPSMNVDPYMEAGSLWHDALDSKFFIDSDKDNPTPSDVYEMTKFTVGVDVNVDSHQMNIICGNFLIIKAEVTTFTKSAGSHHVGLTVNQVYQYSDQNPTHLRPVFDQHQFDMAPFSYLYAIKANEAGRYRITSWDVLGDVNNYYLMSNMELKRIHEARTLDTWLLPENSRIK